MSWPPGALKERSCRISYEKLYKSIFLGSTNPAIAMICAAFEGTHRGASITLKTPPLASQELVLDAICTFTIFHGWVRTIHVHARFYKAKKQMLCQASRIFRRYFTA
jgi:hypothetical protein